MKVVFTIGYKLDIAKPGAAKTCWQHLPKNRSQLTGSGRVAHQLHVRRLAGGHGKHAGHQLVADHVEHAHFVLALGQPFLVVGLQLRIAARGAQGSHVEHLFDLLVCQRADLGFPPHAGARLPLKRGDAGVAGEFAPGGKAGEVVGVGDQIHPHQETHPLDAADQLQHLFQFPVAFHYLPYGLLHPCYLGIHAADHVGVGVREPFQLAGQKKAPLFLLRHIIAHPA